MVQMKQVNDDNCCFVCGTNNPHGLQLTFSYDEENDYVFSNAVFPTHMQGWKDVLHGGVVSMVLDEVMAKAITHKGLAAVTVELNVKFKKPARPGTEYLLKGKVKQVRGKLILAEASITDLEGTVIATADSKFFSV